MWSLSSKGSSRLVRLARPLAGWKRAARGTGIVGLDTVVGQRSLRWFAVVGVAYRVSVLLLVCILNLDLVGPVRQLATAAGFAVVINVALLAIVARRPTANFLTSPLFFGADIALAFILNLWASAAFPPGSLYLPYRDLFISYMWGTVGLWTGLRGPWVGLLLVVSVAVPLQLGMAWFNGVTVDAIQWRAVADRDLWLLTTFVIAAVIARLAKEAALATAAKGLEEGRADALRAMHDTVLQTLARIVQTAAIGDRHTAEERLKEIRAIALYQDNELRAALRQDDARGRGGLATALSALVQEFQGQGLDVELVTVQLKADPPDQVTMALVGAAREALSNVRKHAGVNHAVVWAASSGKDAEVVVRDHGRGFDPGAPNDRLGLTRSVHERMSAIGGDVNIRSAPGRGARVELKWRLND
jgi:signal transduction histidine kinase